DAQARRDAEHGLAKLQHKVHGYSARLSEMVGVPDDGRASPSRSRANVCRRPASSLDVSMVKRSAIGKACAALAPWNSATRTPACGTSAAGASDTTASFTAPSKLALQRTRATTLLGNAARGRYSKPAKCSHSPVGVSPSITSCSADASPSTSRSSVTEPAVWL